MATYIFNLDCNKYTNKKMSENKLQTLWWINNSSLLQIPRLYKQMWLHTNFVGTPDTTTSAGCPWAMNTCLAHFCFSLDDWLTSPLRDVALGLCTRAYSRTDHDPPSLKWLSKHQGGGGPLVARSKMKKKSRDGEEGESLEQRDENRGRHSGVTEMKWCAVDWPDWWR